MDRRPKRRKDKYNPYTLHTEKGKYYIVFIDVNNHIQKVEVSKKIFDSFNKFELEDISQMNEYDRHLEHSEVDENNIDSEHRIESVINDCKVTIYFSKNRNLQVESNVLDNLLDTFENRMKSLIGC